MRLAAFTGSVFASTLAAILAARWWRRARWQG